MQIINNIAILFLVYLLIGCGYYIDNSDLTNNAYETYSFTSTNKQRSVYDKIYTNLKACYSERSTPTGRDVTGEFNNQNKVGIITMKLILPKTTYIQFDIRKDKAATLITVKYTDSPVGSWRHLAKMSEEWSSGLHNSCWSAYTRS